MSLNSFNPCYLTLYHGAKAFASTYGTLEIEGIEHIPEEGCVFASNHVSHLDPPLVGSCIPREIHYLARKTLFKIPVVGHMIEQANSIPVDLERGMDVTTFKRLKSIVAAGHSVLIFPEGTRSADGEMKDPKGGTGMLACSMGLKVVPVRVFGAFDILPRNKILPRAGARVSIVFGKPLEPAFFDPGKADRDRYMVATRRIMSKIAELREPENSYA